MPKLTIVIGANGAGKSTWCRRHRDQLPEHFYNADSIAEGLGDWNSPRNQRAAREIVDRRIQAHLNSKENFGFESTYSGRSRPAIIERARALGYQTTAIFVGTQRPDVNIARVAACVATRTGHDVPAAEIRRRWTASQDYLVHTAHAIGFIQVIDNSGPTTRNVTRIENGRKTTRHTGIPHWARKLTNRIETAEYSGSEVPAKVGKTSARRHITGMLALNIPNAWLLNGGDWHTYASWFGAESDTITEPHLTDEKTYGPLLDVLRRRGLRDARRGLRHLNHPDGWAREKIWAATHERAVIEWAWKKLQWLKEHSLNEDLAPFDGLQVSRWLAYPGQWIRLHWWAWQVGQTLDGEDARRWNQWREQWTPWPEGRVLIQRYLSKRRTTFAKQLSRR